MTTLRRCSLVIALAIASPSAARAAEPKIVCANAAEDAQALRHDGKLREARDKLIVCANEQCPELVRTDCQKWMSEVDAALPTIVLRAQDARGNDVIGVRVSLDGRPFAASLDGKAIALDPGPHRLRFEAAGADPIDLEILVTEGQHNRAVNATFPVKLTASGARDEPAASPAPSPAAAPARESPPPREEPAGATRSIGPYVVGGVGLVALGAFAVLDATAWSDVRSLRDGCGRTQSCASSDVDPVSTRITLAKVALGVGLAGVAAGVTWWFLDTPQTHARVAARPLNGGAALDATVAF